MKITRNQIQKIVESTVRNLQEMQIFDIKVASNQIPKLASAHFANLTKSMNEDQSVLDAFVKTLEKLQTEFENMYDIKLDFSTHHAQIGVGFRSKKTYTPNVEDIVNARKILSKTSVTTASKHSDEFFIIRCELPFKFIKNFDWIN